MGTVWRSEDTTPPSGYEISNNHNLAYYPILTEPATGNTNFNDLNTIWGYNWMQPFIAYEHNYDSIAHGLYKVSLSPGDQYFYLDYRDDRYNWSTVYTQAPGGLDIWILYNKNLNRFMYRKQGLTNPDPLYWTQIQKGDYVGLWTIKEVSNPTTGYFPDFWSNCLSVGDDGHNHPRLIWGRHPLDGVNFGVEEYKIYRAITKGESDDYIQFTHIASVSGDVFNYIDFNAEINPSSVYKLHYKVTATYNNNQESIYETSPTNTVWVFGSLYKKSGSLTEAGYIISKLS